jgi:hypothetical protein
MNKMYVWPGTGEYFAVASAGTVDAARKLLAEEIEGQGDESTPVINRAIQALRETNPEIYHRPNAVFALTTSGELEEQLVCNEIQRKKIKDLEKRNKELFNKIEPLLNILERTAEQLHGGCCEDKVWPFEDLPQIAQKLRETLESAKNALRSYEFGNVATELAEEMAENIETLLKVNREGASGSSAQPKTF